MVPVTVMKLPIFTTAANQDPFLILDFYVVLITPFNY
ncbi:hypothetical protein PAECIP111891_05209 [Paenibacillus allorhizoplanae]|uniref:Uncharacterized protein n=1 Tax=Paenibacillus allorhizoplanae TaxID=2905648 RepID=A0ABM9CQM3_9BACL|nr:hypothetical protein PAECIP111891_05209 [Paenibacillus allorhizoplanae]